LVCILAYIEAGAEGGAWALVEAEVEAGMGEVWA